MRLKVLSASVLQVERSRKNKLNFSRPTAHPLFSFAGRSQYRDSTSGSSFWQGDPHPCLGTACLKLRRPQGTMSPSLTTTLATSTLCWTIYAARTKPSKPTQHSRLGRRPCTERTSSALGLTAVENIPAATLHNISEISEHRASPYHSRHPSAQWKSRESLNRRPLERVRAVLHHSSRGGQSNVGPSGLWLEV